ncbi:MAG: L-seryl-tRNA(Sec) selenium transferase [Nitrospirales bacterium]|nr:L-seryl-tRNA(Sec) selenium transferase [Nitrospirales bacterium]
MEKKALLSSLPSVDEVLKSPEGIQWLEAYPRRYVLQAVREVINHIRQAILNADIMEVSLNGIIQSAQKRIEALSSPSLRPLINATGVVIHTNLGRSVLPSSVMTKVAAVASGYSTLEYDLLEGKRGKRQAHIRRLLQEVTGAEDGIAVNNNAAAVFLCLSAIAKGREVIVSRGELVEIGGSFRIPDVMTASGANLIEVGATNKTHIQDYKKEISENSSLLLKVHQSNYRMVGFTKEVSPEELVSLGRKHGIPVMYDLGSGCLIDLKPYGIHIEPTVQEIVKSGCDIVTFSGDKLLGGPQAGIIVGKTELIQRISKHPLMRAMRIDKLTLAALEATLMLYLDEEKAKREVPTLRMLLQKPEEIKARAKRIVARLKRSMGQSHTELVDISLKEDSSPSGGGALPEIEFPTFCVSLRPKRLSVNRLEERLRRGEPPIITRIKENTLLIDCRTVGDHEVGEVVKGVRAALE